jgi:tripartite-type tricarboxylate transporter receptor subunit TctC
MFVAIGPAKALIKAGKIRPIAIAGDVRHPTYPDLPTMKEGGVDITMPFWESITVPAGTPKDVIAKLDKAISKTFQNPDVQKKINDSGLNVSYLNKAEIDQLRSASDKNVKKMIMNAGLMQ